MIFVSLKDNIPIAIGLLNEEMGFLVTATKTFFFLQSKENERKSTIFKPSSSMLLTPLTALPFSTT